MQSAPRHPLFNVQRQQALFVLAFGLLVPLACAQGVEETPAPDEPFEPSGGSDDGGGGSGSSVAGSGSAGNPNSTAGQGNSSAGSAAGGSKGGAGSGGKGGGSSAGSGGKGGAGSGGKGGTGGTSNGGSAGSAGSAAGGPSGTAGSSSVAGFSVQYKILNTSAMDAYISCEIVAKNGGSTSLPVSDLKVRYYFTDEPKKTNTFQNNFQHIKITGNQAELKVTQAVVGLAPTKPTADTYIEFSFSSGSHPTLAPGEALDFAWQMQSADPAKDTFNETNDYSFDAS